LSIFTDILGGGIKPLIDGVKDLIGATNTTDKERLELENKADALVQDFVLKVGDQLIAAEGQITARQQADMASDSWLSKNVRPMTLMFLTVATVMLAYITIFALPPEKVALLKPWVDMLTSLLMTVYGFYFGSRGLEKIGQMVSQTLKTK